MNTRLMEPSRTTAFPLAAVQLQALAASLALSNAVLCCYILLAEPQEAFVCLLFIGCCVVVVVVDVVDLVVFLLYRKLTSNQAFTLIAIHEKSALIVLWNW